MRKREKEEERNPVWKSRVDHFYSSHTVDNRSIIEDAEGTDLLDVRAAVLIFSIGSFASFSLNYLSTRLIVIIELVKATFTFAFVIVLLSFSLFRPFFFSPSCCFLRSCDLESRIPRAKRATRRRRNRSRPVRSLFRILLLWE